MYTGLSNQAFDTLGFFGDALGVRVGIVEFSVEYFLFIPLVLAMLFDPMSAALGAATGELVFSEIMLRRWPPEAAPW